MKNEQVITTKTNVGLQVDANIRNKHHIKIDEPEFNGGTDTGITPVELELAALGASLQEETEKIAEKNNFSYRKLIVNLEGDIDLDGMHGNPDIPNGFQEIRINFNFDTDDSKSKIDSLIDHVIQDSKIYHLINGKSKVVNVVAERKKE